MKVLRNKSGVSLIFVLAVMLMLLAIGVSALTAASLNFGAGVAQRERSQAGLYVSSMEQTVKASLMDMDNPDSLGGIILSMASEADKLQGTMPYYGGVLPIYVSGQYPVEFDDIDVDLPAGLPVNRPDYEITISGKIIATTVNPNITYDSTGLVFESRTLQAISVSGRIIVTQETEYNGRTIATETTYRFEGCVLKEDGVNTEKGRLPLKKLPGTVQWAVERYETLDSTS